MKHHQPIANKMHANCKTWPASVRLRCATLFWCAVPINTSYIHSAVSALDPVVLNHTDTRPTTFLTGWHWERPLKLYINDLHNQPSTYPCSDWPYPIIIGTREAGSPNSSPAISGGAETEMLKPENASDINWANSLTCWVSWDCPNVRPHERDGITIDDEQTLGYWNCLVGFPFRIVGVVKSIIIFSLISWGLVFQKYVEQYLAISQNKKQKKL